MARFIATVFIVSVCALTGCSSFAHSSTQTISIDTSDVNSATLKSANGLSLSLSLDSTTYQPGQQVGIVIDEKNTLGITNKINASEKWPVSGLGVGPCGTLNYPFGVAIFQGDYSVANVSSATPLQIYEPGILPLPNDSSWDLFICFSNIRRYRCHISDARIWCSIYVGNED
jgi:hypothetical protein